MDVKKIALCLLAAVFMLTSCSSQPTEGNEDFAAADASASTDGSADIANENLDQPPSDEFSENTPPATDELPGETPTDQGLVDNQMPADDLSMQQPAQDSLVPQEAPPMEENIQQPMAEQPTPMPAPTIEEQPAPPANQMVRITNVEFKGNESGGTLVISTSGEFKYNQSRNSSSNQLIIEIPNSTLDKKASRPLLLKDFKGGIGAVSTYYSSSNQTTRIVLELRENAPEILLQPELNSLLVVTTESATQTDQVVNTDHMQTPSATSSNHDVSSPRAGSVSIAEAFNTKSFEGEEIDCNFNEISTKELLLFIGEQIGANIIVDDIPESTVDINIQTVPWDHCMAVILKLKKLGYSKIGNILRISTMDNIKKENEEAIKSLKDSEELAPLKVRLFPISFAEGKDLEKLISSFLTKNRGNASFDSRTNSFIVTDTDEVLRQIGIMIKNLDTPPRQVLIEGKIVEASTNFSKQMGINWGFSGAPVSLGSKKTTFTPNFSIGSIKESSENSLGFTVGVVDFIGSLTASLALLEKEDKVKVLSSPRIVTINNNAAKISTTATIKPVSKDNTGKFTEGSALDLRLNLDVTPQVTNDGSVKMKIDVNRDFSGIAPDPTIPGSAPKYTRQISTNVLVKNGQTSVIGGVFQNDTSEGEVGLPGLRDIPILGFLFRQRQTAKTNTELLVFLTPKILSYNENGDTTN
ncbi:MAG: type IV pilus secretin PilQ [Bdellovibrionaceae bacterium]|nr:type IV pilus secretin PilQ [Pseudobdellovibrionaceae bacterium]